MSEPAPTRSSAPALDFEALYRGSRDDVCAYVATMLRDRSAAEDVTAAAFERAYRKQGTFHVARGSERAWLFGIARNAALDELRRRKRAAALAADPADVDARSPTTRRRRRCAVPPSAPRSRRSGRASASWSRSSSMPAWTTPSSRPCSASASRTPVPGCTAP